MSFKKSLRRLIERATGLRIYRNLPLGLNFHRDLARALPNYPMRIVFDVGANVGQSAAAFREDFPMAEIYCFEPVAESFKTLKSSVQGAPNVHLFNVAIGAAPARGTMIKAGSSKMFFLKEVASNRIVDPGTSSEEVEVVPLDQFCEKERVDHISFLKVDTEGADLEVLRGADAMLSRQKIDFVEVEAGMNPANKVHVPFETLKSHLESRGYLLFALYEQVQEWPTNRPNLRRINPLFISSRLVAAYPDCRSL